MSQSLCAYTAPTIDNSECPALLGLASLVASRAILDCGRRTLYLCAEGDVQVITPPGSEAFDLETSATGHLILPVTNYTDADLSEERHGESQTRHLWADEPSGAAVGSPPGLEPPPPLPDLERSQGRSSPPI